VIFEIVAAVWRLDTFKRKRQKVMKSFIICSSPNIIGVVKSRRIWRGM
jgi:hypothetical protein